MKRLRGLAVAALTITVIVIGLSPIATAASAQTIIQTQKPPPDPCSGLPFQEGCEIANAIGKVWAELEKASHPDTAAQLYFDSFEYVKDCGTNFIKGKLAWVLTLAQWKKILGVVFKVLTNNQIQNFWDRYQEIRDFPLTPWGGCFPPAWVIKANHPGLWKALSNVWLVPVSNGAILLPIFSLPHSSSPPAKPTTHPTTGPQVPIITGVGTYTQGELVYFDINYADPGHDAAGFGFVGVNGSGWAEENHLFSSPSYGIVGPDSIAYPFNEECGTAQQYDSYVEAWINDTAGQHSTPVVIHLVCTGSAGSAG
jgi:hypothetical protein